MRLKWLGLVFPLCVLGLMAAERLATFLLGSHPSAALLWAISLELRSIFGYSAGWLEAGTGHLMPLQIALLAAIGALLVAATGLRRWASLSFLVNHSALLFVGMALLFAHGNRIASSGEPFADSGQILLSGWTRLEPFHYALLTLGLLGCASCHYLFLSQKAAAERAVAQALRELSLNLEGRRRAR